jgi:alkanesulfonate monooxygenase SsuD/methylene tetrahydromethanopterin reductase-like flavin-dependent oxidoreductase (luciferase family)
MTDTSDGSIRFGLQLWSQQTSWAEFRDHALLADETGWDMVCTWDHLMAIFGPWEQPIFEGWSVLAALGPITKRVRLSLMVGANTFRNPGLTAKLATTLDHVSDGRAILAIGGAWFDREHEAYGIEFGRSTGERLDWLDEAVVLMRRLLDGERFDHEGTHYRMRDALANPRPIQAHLPILIGGSGRQKTLRTVARYADAWNTAGSLEEVRESVDVLHQHADTAGRDLGTLEMTLSFPIVIRDDEATGRARMDELLAHNGVTNMGPGPHLAGPPEAVADAIRPFLELGFRTIIVRMSAPYDRETIERMGEVAALLPR